ncbi:tyrosine-type recombinase/integrase [Burkholderia ubonensis]|uniref:tyrosine-type recombinase/integrase n=1 Tax=Burkholderia ubonensis TaxID=101571 RepID=UPI000F561735|nr:site-specific integrase [Burkholderia ubonensis]RQP36499.1 site-specific integrase [Burkholderia ubonensis]RQP46670.1 site-specific integrase [Burkholderia ubonensis]RQP47609.1 site-specific integrase [Burkholderia ubonensis]RQP61644.1 site-specific integrase [Burkholderia ubonensis]RQP61899.1 site-specific integrase [Burkholderia ubonensis]
MKLAKQSAVTHRKTERAIAALPPAEAIVVRQMLDAWTQHRRGALRHTQESVATSTSSVTDFMLHTRKAPWNWTEKLFDDWCYEIGVVRGNAESTQRKHQIAIREFLKYLCESVAFQNQVRLKFGRQVQQICSSRNMLPHKIDRELDAERNALSRAHIELFFVELDEQIQIAHQFSSKSLRPLQRDKILFAVMYYGGLRADEALTLNVTSFHEDPQNPVLGKYASATVWGKGSNGSGKKMREVWFTTLDLPPLIEFYLTNVRPHFLKPTNPDEQALFLSQRGTRLGYPALHKNFRQILHACGFHGMGYCPHSLRHSSVTHEGARFSLSYNRDKHGHVFASTTERYYHGGSEANGEELNRALQAQVDGATRQAARSESQKAVSPEPRAVRAPRRN